jgi:hypothetical protein
VERANPGSRFQVISSGNVACCVSAKDGSIRLYWILAAIVLLITLTVPRLRPAGIVGCIVLGVMLSWGMIQRMTGSRDTATEPVEPRGRPASPAAAVVNVPVDAIATDELRLTGGGAPFEFSGRIVNNLTDVNLKTITFELTRRDCYENALDPSGCVVLWRDRRWIERSVPGGEAREFSANIWVHGSAPRARGITRDEFKVISATGEPAR